MIVNRHSYAITDAKTFMQVWSKGPGWIRTVPDERAWVRRDIGSRLFTAIEDTYETFPTSIILPIYEMCGPYGAKNPLDTFHTRGLCVDIGYYQNPTNVAVLLNKAVVQSPKFRFRMTTEWATKLKQYLSSTFITAYVVEDNLWNHWHHIHVYWEN